MNYIYGQIYQRFLAARKVVLVAHQKPDGDALGAVIALLLWLDSAGKNARPFCASPVPEEYDYLCGVRRFSADPQILREADLVCVLDSGGLKFAGVGDALGEADRGKIINIDHHAVNEMFGFVNLVLPAASSASEIIYGFLAAENVKISPDIATALLTGLINDTSMFVNAATKESTLDAAGKLLAAGARYNLIYNRLFKKKSVDALSLWGKALERLTYNEEHGVASTFLKLEDFGGKADEESTEGLSNFLSRVLKVPVVMVLREAEGGKIKGSLRTVEDIDVAALAQVFGGGGHKKAAGFTIEGRLEEDESGWHVV